MPCTNELRKESVIWLRKLRYLGNFRWRTTSNRFCSLRSLVKRNSKRKPMNSSKNSVWSMFVKTEEIYFREVKDDERKSLVALLRNLNLSFWTNLLRELTRLRWKIFRKSFVH